MVSGDCANEEFVALLLAHQSRLYGFILSLIPNRTEASDILQETSLVLFRRFADFEPGSNFFAWGCRIALHKVLDYRKRQARKRTVFLSPELMETLAADQLREAEDLEVRAQALEHCLDALRQDDRRLVQSCYRSRVFVKDVAKVLGQPVDTIYRHLRRIRRQLYECVTRRLATEF